MQFITLDNIEQIKTLTEFLNNLGSSELTFDCRVIDSNGEPVGVIQYNGNVDEYVLAVGEVE